MKKAKIGLPEASIWLDFCYHSLNLVFFWLVNDIQTRETFKKYFNILILTLTGKCSLGICCSLVSEVQNIAENQKMRKSMSPVVGFSSGC